MLQSKGFKSIFKEQESNNEELHITDSSSSNSETENYNKSLSFIRKRRCKQAIQKSSSRKQLPKLQIQRKYKKDDNHLRSALSILNTDANRSPAATLPSTTDKSPWNKVRNVFAPVSRTKSNESLKYVLATHSNHLLADNDENQPIDDNSDADSATNCSPSIESINSSSQKSNCAPSELDMLIALIERDNTSARKRKRTKLKRCIKDGFLHTLQRVLETAKSDRKFLEHDKKLGLQIGTQLEVLQLETSYGVHSAIMQRTEPDGQKLRIILDEELAQRVKVGSKLEAFFDPNIEPFAEKSINGQQINVYVQPNKLLLL